MTATARHAATPAAEPALVVVVCDEHLLFADAFAAALRAQGLRALVAPDPARTAQIAIRTGAATVVINPEPSPGQAMTACRDIRRVRPETRLIGLYGEGSATSGRALDAYVNLGVNKRLPLQDLVDVVTGAPAGRRRTVKGPPLTSRWKRSDLEEALPLPAQFLNPRELQVLQLLAAAQSTREMARRLGISVPTARGYIQSIFSKLGVHSRVEALNYAVQHSLVEF